MIFEAQIADRLDHLNHYLSRIAEALERQAPLIPLPVERLRGPESVGILNVRNSWRNEKIREEAARQQMDPEEIERLVSESEAENL